MIYSELLVWLHHGEVQTLAADKSIENDDEDQMDVMIVDIGIEYELGFGMILIISFHKFYVSNLFLTLDSVLQKASTGVNPHYLYVWLPAHHDNVDTIEKLVSINFYCYASFVIFVLNSILSRTDIQRS
jgi:hypothetical protein